MGLFDKLFKINESRVRDIKLTSEEAYIAIMMSAIASDEIVNREEYSHLLNLFTNLRNMNINMQQLESLISRYLKIIKNDGVGSLITAAVGFLNENLKESAFINAVELILIDGVLGEKEQEFMDKLQEAINITDEFAEKVVEILIIKNRGTKSELFSETNPDKLFYE